MEIVLGTYRLRHPGGTEHYTLTAAEHLQRLGHEVTIFVEETGEMADLARGRGLRLAGSEDELPDHADVAYVQESVTAYRLAARYPKTPLVFAVHAVDYPISVPPQLPELVSALVTMHDRATRRAEAFATKAEIVRLRQPVDVDRFMPRRGLREQPQRVLALGNYLRDDRLRVIEAACADARLEAVHVGTHRGNHVVEAGRLLNEADVVVGKARVIVEAMACGRAAYVYDVFGSDGWVTNDTYARLEADNFSGQTGTPPVDVARLRSDLELYRSDMGAANRELAVVHHGAGKHAAQLVELFERVAPRPRPRTTPLREMARLVRVQWEAEERAIGLGLEAGSLWDKLERNRLEAAKLSEELERQRLEAAALRDELARHRRRLSELEPTAAVLERRGRELEAARAQAEQELGDVLGQRRVRLGIALARPLDVLRRRRR